MSSSADPRFELLLPTEAATAAVAAALAAVARPGDVLALAGDLGAGKTALARAFVRTRAGVATEVPSPTFTLAQSYDLPGGVVWHFDLYRIAAPEDAVELGIEEAMAEGICLIEWPERLGLLLPARRLWLTLSVLDADRRHLVVDAGPGWADRLAGLERLRQGRPA